MRRIATTPLVLGLAALFLAGCPAPEEEAPAPSPPSPSAAATPTPWPSFRGLEASGVAEGYETATEWDVPAGEGVLWKTAVPGLGHSSPVVWGDRVFLTTAVGEGEAELKLGLYGDIAPVEDEGVQVFRVLAYDTANGEVVWQRDVSSGVPKVKRHTKSTHANSTPATDGEHLVAFFGSEGLYAFDLDGGLLWQKDLGVLDAGFFQVPSAQWGFGSSPVIHDGRVIVQCDVLEGSFLAAFDAATGDELWRTSRDDVPTWSTPTVHATGGVTQVLVNGFRHAGGYDFETGEELWRLRGRGDIPVPTPIVGHDLVFLTHSHGGKATYAVRLGARGDVTLGEGETADAGVAWSDLETAAYLPTPILYGDLLYVVRDNGVLSIYDARTGELALRDRVHRSTGAVTASPVAAGGKLYFTSEDGEVFVLAAGREPELLARNDLGEPAMATPAISAGVLYFRTRAHLVAIGGAP